MSIKVTSYVWEHSKQKGSVLLLLLAIADFADDDGVAFPGIERLSKKARTVNRNVQKLIEKATSAGELVCEHNKGAITTHGPTNRYTVVTSWNRKYLAENGLLGMNASSPGERQFTSGMNASSPLGMNASSPLGMNASSPKPSVEPSVEPSVNTDSTACAVRTPIVTVSLGEILKAALDYEDGKLRNIGIAELIKAWLDASGTIDPTAYQKKGYRTKFGGLYDKGITPANVTAYLKAMRADPFWRDKRISVDKLAGEIVPWLKEHAQIPAPKTSTPPAPVPAAPPRPLPAAWLNDPRSKLKTPEEIRAYYDSQQKKVP